MMLKRRKSLICLLVTAALMVTGCSKMSEYYDRIANQDNSQYAQTTAAPAVTPATKAQPLAPVVPTTTAAPETSAQKSEATYANNDYYDVVEVGSYSNSIGYTYLVHKVLAKADVTVEGKVLAYDAAGNVIEKATDRISLTKGKTNFFKYSFSQNLSGASLQYGASLQNEFMEGERNAVEMEKYNKSGDHLYLTVKQTGTELGAFAGYRLLLYKGDQIVGTEEGFFNISSNLTGKGSTDVVEIWVYGKDFDRVEYSYEP